MRRDVLRTIGGIVVVGLVVVATFLYGNHQSQQQIRKQQQLETKAKQQTAASQTKPTPSPKPAPLPAQPQARPTAIPQTGAGSWSILVGLGLLIAARFYRQSRHSFEAARRLYKHPTSA